VHFSYNAPSKKQNSHKNNQLALFITFSKKPPHAYARAWSLRTNTVEQSVDNQFITVAAPHPAWAGCGCSFFDQSAWTKPEPEQGFCPHVVPGQGST
jgi:hypothetical protein